MHDLGVIINNWLNFSDLIDFVVKRRNRELGLLLRSLQGAGGDYGKEGMIAAYYANVRYIQEYGSIIWAVEVCTLASGKASRSQSAVSLARTLMPDTSGECIVSFL